MRRDRTHTEHRNGGSDYCYRNFAFPEMLREESSFLDFFSACLHLPLPPVDITAPAFSSWKMTPLPLPESLVDGDALVIGAVLEHSMMLADMGSPPVCITGSCVLTSLHRSRHCCGLMVNLTFLRISLFPHVPEESPAVIVNGRD